MYSYTPTQFFTLQHQQQQHQQQQHLQHAMLARRQQEANLLFHQYNQLHSMQTAYSTPTLTPVTYAQQPIDPQQQQQQQQTQVYRPDQLVPQTQSQIPTPVQQQQLQQQLQQQIQSSSPINMVSISSPDIWLAGSSVPQNSTIFRPIPHTVSHSMLDMLPYSNRPNSISGEPSSLPINTSFDSPPSTHHYYSDRPSSAPKNHQHRERSHSGSSCYESDGSNFSDDNEEFGWLPTKSRASQHSFSSSLTRNRSNSNGRSSVPFNEMLADGIYQNTLNNSGVFPVINTLYRSSTKNSNNDSRPKLIQYIYENIIGKNHIFNGPWGLRRMIYCDYTASGRPLKFIEDYIRTHVLPLYGNTHSETSLCAQQSTKFREEARRIIKKSVNANENDILLFTGTGSTGAVHTLANVFDLHNAINKKNIVVMVSAFEHHSNILPWKEKGVELVRLPTTQQGILDKNFLKEKLQYYSQLKKRIICSLNAASNITGIYTDVDAISTLVHSYSGLIFWDYATAAPYVKIDMNPSATAYKDAVFISTHKFIGGPGTPGILIAKQKLFTLNPPKTCGGGTVNFVTRTCHEYNYHIETREEGGTPDVIGCIRAGLVFQLKDSLDMNYIQTREDELVKRFHRRFKNNSSLILLGSQTAPRLPIFSFAVYIPGVCKYLHQNLVCRLFNDLFGIQVRSGCACAGPYAHDLLNISDATTDVFCLFMTENVRIRGNEKITRTMMMKPGFTRLNLPYFASDEEIDYILDAVEFVATHGWKFLPLYTYNPATAAWSVRGGFELAHSSLEDISYKSGKMQYQAKKRDTSSTRGEKTPSDPLREAKLLAADAPPYAIEAVDYTSDPPLNIPEKYKHFIWFALPIDIALMILRVNETGQALNCDVNSIPFIPDDAKARILAAEKNKSGASKREPSANRKKNTSSRGLSTTYAR